MKAKTLLIISTSLLILISACEDLPVASFLTSADSYLVGDTVYFQSACHNATSLDWDFDDGTVSSEENPSHIYTDEGKFTVVLEASNKDGSDVARKSLYIEKTYPCWTELANLKDPRHNHTSVAYNNLVYVVSGSGNATVEAYDPATNEWTFKATRPMPTSYLMSCELDGKVYCLGGRSESVTLTTVDVYDLETDSWSEGTPLITPRMFGSAVSCNGKIYVLCGIPEWGGDKYISTMEIYDPVADTWVEKPCPVPAWEPATVAMDGKIYVIGGYYGSGDIDRESLSTTWKYDPEEDRWDLKNHMPTGRWGAACVVLDNLIYVIGGGLDFHFEGSWTNDCNIVEVYDPSSDSWESRSPMPVKRTVCAACVLDDKIYVSGGAFRVSSRYDNFHVYDTACDTKSNQ